MQFCPPFKNAFATPTFTAACPHRTGERDRVDAGVRGERLADRGAVAGDEVDDAVGQPRLVQHVEQQVRDVRRDLARLDHDGAPGGERGRELAGDLVQRVCGSAAWILVEIRSGHPISVEIVSAISSWRLARTRPPSASSGSCTR
ncbi:hypothetical protein GCM10009559_18250 [Pseudonocardia zijingensis]|uniref:Uncharacterized protein n=1 Tax=Pseudonocardia zijingensis TaxID=153376 RepID=A0ABN1PN43_9PSEU